MRAREIGTLVIPKASIPDVELPVLICHPIVTRSKKRMKVSQKKNFLARSGSVGVAQMIPDTDVASQPLDVVQVLCMETPDVVGWLVMLNHDSSGHRGFCVPVRVPRRIVVSCASTCL